MKYLHDAALADLTALLSDCPVWSSSSLSSTHDGTNNNNSAAANSRTLHGRLEAYTTKRAGSDKKLAVNVSDRYIAEQEAAVADDKLAALIHFQKDQLLPHHHHMASSNNSNTTGGGRKRRSASTGEEPLAFQKSRQIASLSSAAPTTSEGRRNRAYSLDIPRPINSKDATRSSTSEAICNTSSTLSPPRPQGQQQQPNFKALSLAAVNRRLLTDLILTLNHSFPDYDFANAGINDFIVCSVQTAVTRINERLGEFSAATSSSTLNSSIFQGIKAGNNNSGGGGGGSSFLSTLWKAVDNVIHLSEVTEVYSYQPSSGELDDPHSFLKHSLIKNGWGDDVDIYEMTGTHGSSGDMHRTNSSNRYGGRLVQTGDDDMSEYDDDDDGDNMNDTYNSRPAHGSIVHREVLWTFNYFFVNKTAKRILLFTCIETMTRSGYSVSTPIVPLSHGIAKTKPFNAIPEHEVVHHQLRNNTSTTPTSELKRKRTRRRLKYLQRQSSPSILPSDDDISGHDDDDDDDEDSDDDDDDGEEYDDASSSAVSVDFDLDPANAVSGGIPIGI